jgi:uncharacterized membrane protein required for colicin V production
LWLSYYFFYVFALGAFVLGLKVLDFVLLAFLVLFFFFGYRKGFFRSILSFFGLLVISLVVPNISSSASKKVYKDFIEKKVLCITEKVLGSDSEKVYKKQLDKALRNLDPISSSILKRSDACNIEAFIANKSNKDAVNNIVKEKALRYIDFLLTLIISLVLMVVFKILLKRFSLRNLPVIGGIDAVLGGTLGVLECLVLIFAFFYVFSLICANFNEAKSSFALYNKVNESLAFKFFKEFNFWDYIK